MFFLLVGALHTGKNLWSYQDWYRLVTARIHSDFIVQLHWKTDPLAPSPDILLRYITLIMSKPLRALSH